jgi:hypothetical protein
MLSLIAIILFPFVIWGAWKNVKLARASVGWPSVPGKVTVATTINRLWRRQPRVTYTYQVNGRDHTGLNIVIGNVVADKETDDMLAKYPVGADVTVYYSPIDPSVSVLEPGPNEMASKILKSYVVIFILVLFVNLLLVGVNIWTAKHQDADAPAPTYDDAATAGPSPGDQAIQDGANNGDAADESYVGNWYLTGQEGYTKDPVQAAVWLQKAAAQGDAGAETLLAGMYVQGTGVTKDVTQGIDWLQKAAAQNYPPACFDMGRAYEKGIGSIPQDNQQAIQWYMKAGNIPQAKEALQRLGAQ